MGLKEGNHWIKKDECLENWYVGTNPPGMVENGRLTNLWHKHPYGVNDIDEIWYQGAWVVNHFGYGQWRCTVCLINPPQEIIDCCDLLGRKKV